MKIYCQKCGTPHNSMEKPNFCTNCGNSFNSKMAAASSVNPRAAKQIRPRLAQTESSYSEEDDDGFETEIDTDLAFSASKLDVDIEKEESSKIKIENVLGTSSSSSIEQRGSEGGYTMDDFRREAGSIKNQ